MKVLLLAACDFEYDATLQCMDNVTWVKLLGRPYYEGTLRGRSVILARTYMGMVNAAVATTAGIEAYKPDCVINMGTAGGYLPQMKQGDIVVAERFINGASFKTQSMKGAGHGAFDRLEPLAIEVAGPRQAREMYDIEADMWLVNKAKELWKDKQNVYFGTIASADTWNREAERIKYMSERFGVCCEEMEGYAVAQSAAAFETPCIGIRVVSNNELTGGEYSADTALACEQLVWEYIEKL